MGKNSLAHTKCNCKYHIVFTPKIAVSIFMGYLKGKSSLMIFDRYANLKYKYGNRTFWCRGYYVEMCIRDRCSFFVSKLTREDKIEIYERRKNGETISSLAKAFDVYKSTIEYLIALIKKHGYDILRDAKNRVYSKMCIRDRYNNNKRSTKLF